MTIGTTNLGDDGYCCSSDSTTSDCPISAIRCSISKETSRSCSDSNNGNDNNDYHVRRRRRIRQRQHNSFCSHYEGDQRSVPWQVSFRSLQKLLLLLLFQLYYPTTTRTTINTYLPMFSINSYRYCTAWMPTQRTLNPLVGKHQRRQTDWKNIFLLNQRDESRSKLQEYWGGASNNEYYLDDDTPRAIEENIYHFLEQLYDPNIITSTSSKGDHVAKLLVAKGLELNQLNSLQLRLLSSTGNGYDKVRYTGCGSSIYIKTSIKQKSVYGSSDTIFIVEKIDGISDSIMNRGLVSCMYEIVQGCTIDDIEGLDADEFRQTLIDANPNFSNYVECLTHILYTIKKQIQYQTLFTTAPKTTPVTKSSDPVYIPYDSTSATNYARPAAPVPSPSSSAAFPTAAARQQPTMSNTGTGRRLDTFDFGDGYPSSSSSSTTTARSPSSADYSPSDPYPQQQNDRWNFQTVPASPQQQQARSQASPMSTIERNIQQLSILFKNQSTETILKMFVQRGMDFARQQQQKYPMVDSTMILNNPTGAGYEKVIGCTSNVCIRTNLEKTYRNEWIIESIDAVSDSMVSGGIVAYLIDIVTGCTIDEILRYEDSNLLTERLNVKAAFVSSFSRNNAFVNIFHSIQKQILTQQVQIFLQEQEQLVALKQQQEERIQYEIQQQKIQREKERLLQEQQQQQEYYYYQQQQQQQQAYYEQQQRMQQQQQAHYEQQQRMQHFLYDQQQQQNDQQLLPDQEQFNEQHMWYEQQRYEQQQRQLWEQQQQQRYQEHQWQQQEQQQRYEEQQRRNEEEYYRNWEQQQYYYPGSETSEFQPYFADAETQPYEYSVDAEVIMNPEQMMMMQQAGTGGGMVPYDSSSEIVVRGVSVEPPVEEFDARIPMLERNIQRIAQEFAYLSNEEILRTLAHKGIQFQQPAIVSGNIPLLYEEVTDYCGKSTVYIRTITKQSVYDDEVWYIDSIDGLSDSIISRGIVLTIIEILQGCSVNEILAVDPYSVVDLLDIRSAFAIVAVPSSSSSLPYEFDDGFASIVRTIQRQIQQQMIYFQKDTALFLTSTAPSLSISGDLADEETATPPNRKKKVALLLSGGVDSSVSLHLLLQQNYDVTAFYLRIWLEDELQHLGTACPWEEDYNTCIAVVNHASELYNVPVELRSLSLQQQYQDRVIQYTIEEAKAGRTPNPDILCNSRIKFGCFYDAIFGTEDIDALFGDEEFDYIATGHYAQLARNDNNDQNLEHVNGDNEAAKTGSGSVQLLRAPDPVKDQTYFLCALTQQQLSKCLFPIGQYMKHEVREMAEEFGLPNRNRPDSQGLCFLGKVKFDQFLASYLGSKPGPIVDASTGEYLGQHNGIWYHTVGQRKGIGKVLTPAATSRGPWYVVAKDTSTDTVYCSNHYDDDETFTKPRSEVTIENIHWISGSPPESVYDMDVEGNIIHRFQMKIRHGPRLVNGTLTMTSDTASEGDIRLDEKDGGLAPGQYVVFYDDDSQCLGCGVISERHWIKFLLERTQTAEEFPTIYNGQISYVDNNQQTIIGNNNTQSFRTKGFFTP